MITYRRDEQNNLFVPPVFYKKIPTATGDVLSGGILGRIQLANAIES